MKLPDYSDKTIVCSCGFDLLNNGLLEGIRHARLHPDHEALIMTISEVDYEPTVSEVVPSYDYRPQNE